MMMDEVNGWEVRYLPVLNAINEEINGVHQGNSMIKFSFTTASQRVSVGLESGSRLWLSMDLGITLGFGGEVTLTEFTTAPYISDISGGIHSLYIYSNIVDSQIVDDVKAPLLRMVSGEGKHGSIITRNFNNLLRNPSTALRNISARLVQQTLRTVSIVFLTLLDFVRTFVLFTLIVLTVLT